MIGPGGDDKVKFLNLLEFAGLAVARPANERTYSAEIQPNAVFDYLVLLVLARSNRVVQLMEENPERVAATMTGENILSEQSVQPSVILDFDELLPWYAPTFFTLFATPNSVQRPELNSLSKPLEWSPYFPSDQKRANFRLKMQELLTGTTVYTSFPRATRDFFGSADINIIPESGKLEGLWQINSSNLATADVSVSKETAKANRLRLLLDMSRVDKLGLVNNPNTDKNGYQAVSQLLNQILKLPERMGEVDPRVRQPVTLAELNSIDSIKYFFVAGPYEEWWTTAPVLFDEYMQTLEKAKTLLQTKGTLYRRDDSDTKWVIKRLEKFAEPEIISMVNQALQKNGYLLIPKVFTDYLNWLSSPNLDKGGH